MHFNRQIKIIHVGEYVQGGVATYLQTIIGIDKEQISEWLFISDEKSVHSWSLDDKHIIYYSYHRGLMGVFSAMKVFYKIMKKEKMDIVYCHSTWAGVIARVPLLFFSKKPKVIYNAHGWAFTMQVAEWKKIIFALIERMLCHVTDCVVNVSNFEYKIAIAYGLPKEKMRVLYSGSNYVKNRCLKKKIFDESAINILFVGRFDPQKGVDFLLKTFQRCSRFDLHLHLIGDSVLSTNKYNNINDDRIHFLGWVPHEKMMEYYYSCDVVIMPSRWEAFGLVAIEAMKYKKPVIVSDRGALPELIKDNYNGYIFEMENEASLMEVLNKLEKNKLKKLGENSFRAFEINFAGDKMRNKMKDLYIGLLSES